MSNYSQAIALAQRLIREKGAKHGYVSKPAAVPSNAQPWKPAAQQPAVPAAVTIDMLVVDPSSRGSDTQGMVSTFVRGTDIKAGNKLGLVAGGLAFVPQVGDTIKQVSDGTTYKVFEIKTVKPGDDVVLWKLELAL